jgi:FlaA1/EpsC-like NDP-sugar epimerase
MTAFMFLFMMLGRSCVKIAITVRARFLRLSGYSGQRRIVVFGAGEAGEFLISKLDRSQELVKPVVFIDDDENLIGKRVRGIRVYGDRSKLKEAIKRYNADEVIVAVPTASRELLKYVVNVCSECRCRIRRYGTIDDVDLENASVSNINFEDLLRRSSVNLKMESISRFIKGKTVMITGGAGSIGSELCRQVMSFGCEKLIIFDINENGLFFIDNELKDVYGSGRHITVLGSIRDEARLDEVLTKYKPELIFHAAAHKHVPMMEINPKESIKNNVFGTINVAKAAIAHGVEKFILISTDKAVNPANIMGASKRIAELSIQMLDKNSDTDFAAVRFGNVLGSNGSVVPYFQKQINEGGPVTVTHPDMRRYFMTIPEAVQLVLDAGAMANGGEIFVLDMGEPVKIYDLACDMIRLSGYEPNVDIKIEFTGLRPGEKLFEEISLADEDVDKTGNDKIVSMKPVAYDYDELRAHLDDLKETISEESPQKMFSQVKMIVPTFNHNEMSSDSNE